MGGGAVGEIKEGEGTSAEYGAREDEIELRRPRDQDEDEEAQLLDHDDYDQFELDEVAQYSARGGSQAEEGRGGKKQTGRMRMRTPTTPATTSRLISFLRGPAVPQVYSISPILPSLQEFPVKCLNRMFPQSWQNFGLLSLGLLLWTVVIAVLLARGIGVMVDDQGKIIRHMDCADTFWRPDNECGINGVDCQPFTSDTMTFHCPANCAGVEIHDAHYVGRLELNHQPLVIGGPVYRGDSFVCAAAIHAGVIDDKTGGCGTVTLTGIYYSFYSSQQNGIESVGFDSHFPLSFTLDSAQCGKGHNIGKDNSKITLAVSLLSTAILSLFTTLPSIFFFANFIGIFIHVALVSDPPNVSGPSDTILPTLISTLASRLLPSLFCAAIIYQACARPALSQVTPSAQIEKTLLWLGGLWIGALSNYTLGWLSFLSQLTHDTLSQQPTTKSAAAAAALAMTVILLTVLMTIQTYQLWRSGRLLPYLTLYTLILLSVLLLLLSLPILRLSLSIPSPFPTPMLALALLPLTALQTRPSLLYQGLLLGLLIHALAHHGFDAPFILTAPPPTSHSAQSEIPLYPETLPPLIYLSDQLLPPDATQTWNISLKWGALPPMVPAEARPDGISVLVNDVERFRGFYDSLEGNEELMFTWERRMDEVGSTPEYFRFAFVVSREDEERKMSNVVGGYTEAGMWFVNGSWSLKEGMYK